MSTLASSEYTEGFSYVSMETTRVCVFVGVGVKTFTMTGRGRQAIKVHKQHFSSAGKRVFVSIPRVWMCVFIRGTYMYVIWRGPYI